jgi:putative spermidine/putrescine transport system permease protein
VVALADPVITAPVPPPSGDRVAAWRKVRWWRGVILVLAGAYFLLPLYGAARFSFQNDTGQWTISALRAIPHAQGFTTAFFLSLRLAAVTLAITLVLMVPTVVYVHLRLPRFRTAMEVITIVPLVIPPIVLIVGVLQAAPAKLKSTPYLLSLEYVILAMPLVYRSLDSALRAIDLKTLVEASRSLGGSWAKTLLRVVVPNIKSGILSAVVLTTALVLGEFTLASLDTYETVPVWIVDFNQSNGGHVSVAVSLLVLFGTWILLLLIASLSGGSGRRRRTRRAAVSDAATSITQVEG